ncbi:MAG: hypothetical protein AABW73_03915 [Nanoarchaeota archaeon]
MAKLTAWLVTLIGLLLTLRMGAYLSSALSVFTALWVDWVVALSFLAIGVSKLVRNYSYK